MNKFEAPSLSVEELTAALYNVNLQLQQTNEQLKEKSAALEKANSELVEKTEKLIASDKARTEMFANISHDLRSPITAIKSSIEYLLSMENLSETEQREYLQLMNTRVGIMEDFINDIFLLATLESKSVSLKTTELDITALLEEFYCECEVNPRFEKRVLSFDTEDYTPTMVNVDVKQFLRVLDNLFNNALKYSGDGDKISLSVKYIPGGKAGLNPKGDQTCISGSAASKGEVHISVSDTGIGIKPEDIPHIFDRSFMAQRARTPDAKTGFGLGLCITREIVKLHGGEITCESTFGYGSTFTVVMPAGRK